MSEVRVVDLMKLGVNKEVFDKIYSMGEQDGRADAIEECIKALTDYCCGMPNNNLVNALDRLKEKENG